MERLPKLLGSTKMLPLLGLGLAFAWAYAPLLVGETCYLYYHLGFGCSLVALAALFTLRPRELAPHGERIASLSAACAMSLTPLALIASTHPHVALVASGGILSGVGSAWLFGRWFQLYCRHHTKLAANYTLASFSISSAIRFALVPLSDASSPLALAAVLCALPFCSLALMRRCEVASPGALALRESHNATAPTSEKPPFSGAVGFFAEVVVYGLVFGVLRNGISDWSSDSASLYIGHALRILLPLLLLAWINIPQNDEKSERVLRGSVLACAFCAAAGIFFGDSPAVAISSLTLAARNFVTILLYLMLYRTVRDCEGHPIAVFGMGRGIYELSLVSGLALFSVTTVSDFINSLSVTALYFVMTCVSFLLLSSFSRITAVIRHTPPPGAALCERSFDERVAAIAVLYHLTEREEEVMHLLCRGRTKRYIAETLYLSEDTVRWHSKQLYRKLNVHSKQELIDLVGV